MRRLNLCRLFAPLALATAAFSPARAVQSARTFEVASVKPSPPLDMAKAGRLSHFRQSAAFPGDSRLSHS